MQLQEVLIKKLNLSICSLKFLKTHITQLVVESESPKQIFKILSVKLEVNNAAKCKLNGIMVG